MSIALRRDDAPILLRYQQLTGLGTITAKAAYRTSKPQAIWTIQSGLECLRLADLLRQYPLRGRKRLEVEIWSQAVRAKERRSPNADLAGLAQQLKAARRYVDPGAAPPDPSADQPGLLWYFGGFFTGEGSFFLSRTQARATIKLRRDDRPLLLAFASLTGLGRVYNVAPCGTANPAAIWPIYARSDLTETIEILSAARLQGRKRREFHIWRIGAEEFVDARREGRPRDASTITAAAEGLKGTRRYRDVALPFPDVEAEQRRAYADALRAYARLKSGALTCTGYMAARRGNPHWPNYDTLARVFGSWPAALAAAGLASRAHWRSLPA